MSQYIGLDDLGRVVAEGDFLSAGIRVDRFRTVSPCAFGIDDKQAAQGLRESPYAYDFRFIFREESNNPEAGYRRGWFYKLSDEHSRPACWRLPPGEEPLSSAQVGSDGRVEVGLITFRAFRFGESFPDWRVSVPIVAVGSPRSHGTWTVEEAMSVSGGEDLIGLKKNGATRSTPNSRPESIGVSKMKKGFVFETAYDTYTVEKGESEGGAGFVFRVKNQNGELLALKLLKPEHVRKSKLKRFKNEISFCKRVDNKHIVSVIDDGFAVVQEVKCPFYVMPLFDSTLRALMKTGISPGDVVSYFGQILDGVESAHLVGTWHRDLKPENILFRKSDACLVVSDFGIAHFEEEFLLTAVETTNAERLANFLYAAPEQRHRGAEVNHLSDIFALGLMLNEMFTGQVPQGTNFKRIGDVDPNHGFLDDLVGKMIGQEPDRRPRTIGAIKDELIALGQKFIARQKISLLENRVIPETEIDDPLVVDPIRVTNYDYNSPNIICFLNRSPTKEWTGAFFEEGANVWTSMFHASMVKFFGHRVVFPATGNAQQAKSIFNEWINNTNRVYAERVARRLESERKKRDLEAAAELAAARERERILKELNG